MFLWGLGLGCWCFPARASDFAFGADLSFLKQAEDRGKVFKDGTNALPGLQIFKNHGYNWIRLRIFVEPVGGNLPNDLAYTLALAKDAKKLGYKFLLDFHYANSWADPGKQPTPEAWKNLPHKERVKKVFEHTRDTIAAFRDADILPDMVQVGNEVTHGMLWPDGQLPQHWDNFTDYIRTGIKGVDAGSGTGVSPVSFKNGLQPDRTGETPVPLPPRPKIMIHIDQGGSIAKTKYFFDNLNRYKISCDVIGFSYYRASVISRSSTMSRRCAVPTSLRASLSAVSGGTELVMGYCGYGTPCKSIAP